MLKEELIPEEPSPLSSSNTLPSLREWILHNIGCTIFGALSIVGYVYTNNIWDKYDARDWCCVVFTCMPLVIIQTMLSVPSLRNYFTIYLYF